MNTDPSPQTIAANHAVFNTLPFEDRQDFEDANRGHIASLPSRLISTAAGRAVWDGDSFDFVNGAAPDSVNPSLWRQAQLNNLHGLFMVCPGIYQVRGYDLSNMTFIEGESGWVVIDTMISAETAKAALDLANLHLGERPVSAIIITHSHIDHYGGIRGIVSDDDVDSGRVAIIAPKGFLFEAVSENVLAGPAMRRRATYMYGNLLQRNERGLVDVGLGITTSSGSIGLIEPTQLIGTTGTELKIDGVQVVFQYTPESEAPAEMMFYFPDHKAFCSAEIATHVMHNLYTLRGTKVRDALLWSKYIHEAMDLFADMEVVFATHHWPTWGNERCMQYLKNQRDIYKYMHDETLRLANQGATMIEIAEQVELPPQLSRVFAGRGYYGTVSHNVKAIYQFYFGWFDGNPANLHPLPPREASEKYLDFMGGAESVVLKARECFDKGDYRWVAQVLNHVVFAAPDHQPARELLAETYHQLGYQAESGPWRNFYLTGAQELLSGAPKLPTGRMGGIDTIKAIPMDLFFDLFAVRLIGPKAAERDLSLNFTFPDTGQIYAVTIENGVLNYRSGTLAKNADAGLTMKRSDWNRFATGEALDTLVEEGALQIDGNGETLSLFFSLLDEFKMWFNIVEP